MRSGHAGRTRLLRTPRRPLVAASWFAVEALDTTAAGDTFCGALTAALSRQETLADALRQASAAGALACTRLGAQSSIPTQAEVSAFLQTQPNASEHRLAALQQYCGITP